MLRARRGRLRVGCSTCRAETVLFACDARDALGKGQVTVVTDGEGLDDRVGPTSVPYGVAGSAEQKAATRLVAGSVGESEWSPAGEPGPSFAGHRRREVFVALAVLLAVVVVATLVAITNDGSGSDGDLARPAGMPADGGSGELDRSAPLIAVVNEGASVRSSPSSDLVNAAVVMLTGEGFGRGRPLGFTMCTSLTGADPHGIDTCDIGTLQLAQATEAGTFVVDYRVYRMITVGGERVDCAIERCVVGAVDDYGAAGSAAVLFDPVGSAQGPPEIVVTPADGVVDGQPLAVVGSGFKPGETLSVRQCILGPDDLLPTCARSTHFYATLDGSFRETAEAARLIPVGDQWLDCAALDRGRCVVVVGDGSMPRGTGTGRRAAAVALSYLENASIPELEITATPTAGLADGQPITVQVSAPYGRRSARRATMRLCPRGQADGCVWLSTTLGSEAGIATGVAVPRRFLLRPHTLFGSYVQSTPVPRFHDCVDDGPCDLVVETDRQENAFPLDFDPSAPRRPLIESAIVETAPYSPGQHVTVEYPAGAIVTSAQQCLSGTTEQICDQYPWPGEGNRPSVFRTNEVVIGEDLIRMQVFRLIHTQLGPFDCVNDGPCELRFRSAATEREFAALPLRFDPDVAAPPGPVVSPAAFYELGDGDAVRLYVSGIDTNTHYRIGLCPTDFSTGEWCTAIHEGRTDDTGSATVELTLPRRDPYSWAENGIPQQIDCAINTCVLRVFSGRLRTDIPLAFDPNQPLLPDPWFSIDQTGPFIPGDIATLGGSGFTRTNATYSTRIEWALCERRPTDLTEVLGLCGRPFQSPTELNSDGTFSIELLIPDPTQVTTWADNAPIRCESTCWIIIGPDPRARTDGLQLHIVG